MSQLNRHYSNPLPDHKAFYSTEKRLWLMKIFLLLLFSLSSLLYNAMFLNLCFFSKMYCESLQFKSLTITLFVFPNLWQATISIVSNTPPSISKISLTYSSSRSFVMLLEIPTISMNSRREHCSILCMFLFISMTFSFNIFVIFWDD